MSTYDLIDRINEMVERHINKEMEQVYANRDTVGLDERCGVLYINDEAVATAKHNDSRLQYYGGFEYVDKDYRQEIGDYVFYFSESSRVQDCIEHFYDIVKEEEQEDA